jgi:hypothetical protein
MGHKNIIRVSSGYPWVKHTIRTLPDVFRVPDPIVSTGKISNPYPYPSGTKPVGIHTHGSNCHPYSLPGSPATLCIPHVRWWRIMAPGYHSWYQEPSLVLSHTPRQCNNCCPSNSKVHYPSITRSLRTLDTSYPCTMLRLMKLFCRTIHQRVAC